MELRNILDEDSYDVSYVIDFSRLIKIINISKDIFEILSFNIGTIIKASYDESDDKIYFLSPKFFDSISNTLKSIIICSKVGHVIDAHVLTRKLRDDLFQWLFILSTIESVDRISHDSKEIDVAELRLDLNEKIMVWFKNTLDHDSNRKLRYSQYEYSKYKTKLINHDENINVLFKEYFKPVFKNLMDLDNYVHGNGQKYVHGNMFEYKETQIFHEHISSLQTKLEDLILCYLSTLMLISPELLVSSDYFDCIDSGQKPDQKLLTTIAPIFQDFFDEFVKPNHNDLIMYLNIKNRYNMVIE